MCVTHAHEMDRRLSPAGTTPIEDHLRSFTPVRGLIFGGYGEASDDVHDVIRECADRQAEQQWRLHGARSAAEMRSFLVSRARRRIGLAAVRAFARHRLSRVPYIGCPREVVQARMRELPQGPRVPAFLPEDFYAFQVGPLAGPAAAAAG